VLVDTSDRRLGLLVSLQIYRDLFHGMLLPFIVSHGGVGGIDEVDTLERGGGGYLSLFHDFVGGMRWILIQGSMSMSSG
jgi:hypothetical protein